MELGFIDVHCLPLVQQGAHLPSLPSCVGQFWALSGYAGLHNFTGQGVVVLETILKSLKPRILKSVYPQIFMDKSVTFVSCPI